MITENDLNEAIAECKQAQNPNANTCVKLAAYYIIKDHLYGEEYSYDEPPQDASKILPVFYELLETIQVLNPHLYEGVMRRLENL